MKCWIIELNGRYYNNGTFGEVPFVFNTEPSSFNGAEVVECELIIPKSWWIINITELVMYQYATDVITGIEAGVLRFNNGKWEELR